MKHPKMPANAERQAELRAEMRRDQDIRQQGYRDRALKLFPHLCARCGREFSGKRLKELTVHHKNHDHTKNPPDGSNWELLCLYCHDHEHEKYKIAGYYDASRPDDDKQSPSIFQPFENLDKLFNKNSDS